MLKRIDYTHIIGRNGWRILDINPLLNGVRPLSAQTGAVLGDPNLFGPVQLIFSVDRSLYDELNFHFERHFSSAAAVQANYTLAWARGMGGLTDGATTTGPAAPYLQTASATGGDINAPWEWGPSLYDERHRVVVTGLFTLPFGIEVAPSLTMASARPYTQYRATNPSGDGSLQVLGADGNPAGVNNARGIPLINLNSRVTKISSCRNPPRWGCLPSSTTLRIAQTSATSILAMRSRRPHTINRAAISVASERCRRFRILSRCSSADDSRFDVVGYTTEKRSRKERRADLAGTPRREILAPLFVHLHIKESENA